MIKIGDEDTFPVDGKIRYCKKCDRCWEYYHDSNRKILMYYYDGFPTIGKKRELCENCVVLEKKP